MIQPVPVSDDGGPAPAGRSTLGCVEYLVLIAVGAWVLLVVAAAQFSAWYLDQNALDSAAGLPGRTWLAITWLEALLIAVPVVPLAWFGPWRSLRPVYRMWAMAAGVLALVALGRLAGVWDSQSGMLAQAAAGLLAAAALWFVLRRRVGAGLLLLPLALILGGLTSVPSLLWGGLGSPIDLALDMLAGLSLGLVAGLLTGYLFAAETAPAAPGRSARVLSAYAAGIMLFILASGYGLRGSQLLLMIALPPLALIATALFRVSRVRAGAWLAAAAVVGVVAAGLLAFWDPGELNLVLGDVINWALRAAEWSLLLAVLLGIILWAVRRPLSAGAGQMVPMLVGLAVVAAALGVVYARAGQPGFHGDQFFVILRDQANVQPAYAMTDRTARLRYVYTTLVQHAQQTQANLRAYLDRNHVGYRPYYLVNALQVDASPALAAYLARQPEVDRVIHSQTLRPIPVKPEAETGSLTTPGSTPWNITSIGADRVWNELGVTGKGIVIGQSDSGVQGDHPALADGYRGAGGKDDYNWLDPWYHSRRPTDVGGHGTHTLGSALGRGGIGVAPGASWMACVNLARNLGNPGWYLNCMQFMLAPYPQNGDAFRDGDPARAAYVLNNSWGCPAIEGCDANALAPATAALRAAGIFVVASAGNSGPACGTVTDPISLYPDVFTVGAVDRHGELADFSSRGPVTADGSNRIKPDVIAPGVGVISSFPGNTYQIEAGTSMAGPHVAGVVALMWSAQPKLVGNIDRTTQILIQTAKPYDGVLDSCGSHQKPNDDVGYGIVDAYAAVQAALKEP